MPGTSATGGRQATRRRVAGAGAAGLAGVVAVLAVGPAAYATPTSPATPAATADQVGGARGASRAATPRQALDPDYGDKKIRVGVQEKDGTYPPGADTSGSTIKIVRSYPDGTTYHDTCTTTAKTRAPGSTATYCYFDNVGAADPTDKIPDPTNFDDENYFYIARGEATVTITQTTVGTNVDGVLVKDASVKTYAPCLVGTNGVGLCDDVPDAVFTDPGIPPIARDDRATTPENTPVAIKILANDDTVVGAPVTGLTVTSKPTHGSVDAPAVTAPPTSPPAGTPTSASPSDTASQDTVRRAAAPAGPAFTYTPAKGFVGVDHFTYRLTDANGSDTAVVTITVTGPATPSVSASSSTSPPLATTGSDSTTLLGLGALLLASGGLTAAVGRRTRRGRHAA